MSAELLHSEVLLRLVNSDWTQLPDCPLSDEKKQEFAEYRAKLRKYQWRAGSEPLPSPPSLP